MSVARHPVPIAHFSTDLLALGALALFTGAIGWDAVGHGSRIGLDSSVFFYPMFDLLGDRLAAGDWLPGWNPHQFAGAPLAADPQSGWGYVPAMLLFALLPTVWAAAAFVVAHLALVSFGTYAFARVLGVPPVGALTAGIAFSGSGFVRDRAICCFAHVMVAAWIPPLLLATELAIQSDRRSHRIGWWLLAGVALSQILAGWLGQGAVYALLTFGFFIVVRTVLATGQLLRPLVRRIGALVLHGGAILVIGFGLSATTLLPRLEYNNLSSLKGGYEGQEAVVGGFYTLQDATRHLLWPSGWYAGGAALALALVAMPLARRRFATPLLAVLAAGALALCFQQVTPLHSLLYAAIPWFEQLHRHYPERILLVVYLGVALLAGAAVATTTMWPRHRWLTALIGTLPVVLLAALENQGAGAPTWARGAIVAVAALLVLGALLPGSAWRVVIPIALTLTVTVDGLVSGRDAVDDFPRVDLARYYAAGPSGAYLQERARQSNARYFGYAPEIALSNQRPVAPYRYLFADPFVAALIVNDRATALGLEDIQGYNPIQLQRFVEAMNWANGREQEYREMNVLPDALASPLLDLLGTRYIVVSATRAMPPELSELPTVYEDPVVKIIERPNPLPRVWLVHEARQVRPGDGLIPILDGSVDPRRVALIEHDPPPLSAPASAAADRATLIERQPDRLVIRTRSDAPALLMLGELAYPAWQAELDGEPVDVVTADHLLRAVAVPAGEHTVTMRYVSSSLLLGTAISLATLAGAAALWLLTLLGDRRRRKIRRPSVATAGRAW